MERLDCGLCGRNVVRGKDTLAHSNRIISPTCWDCFLRTRNILVGLLKKLLEKKIINKGEYNRLLTEEEKDPVRNE